MDFSIAQVSQPAEGHAMEVNHLSYAGVLGLAGHAIQYAPILIANRWLSAAWIRLVAAWGELS
jgi:hypothetical protein